MEEVIEIKEPSVKNNRSVRFSDAPWYKPGIPIIIGGAGGIGSWLAMSLARQECELYVYDYDTIDETNMGGQHFTSNDIDKPKVQAVVEQARAYSRNLNVHPMNERYTKDTLSNPIVFSAFDNMEARKIMFENWLENNSDPESIFIDGRLLAESFKVFAVTPKNAKKYKDYLWDDTEIPDVECSYKATTHCSMLIAGMMTSIFNNHMTNIILDCNVREVPFLTEVELPLMSFKFTEDGQ